MRKRNCDKLFDNIMWYLIYLLPLIVGVLIYMSPELFNILYDMSGYSPTSFGGVMYDLLYDMGISLVEGNLADSFYYVFGSFGTTGNEVWYAMYLAYIVLAYCGHLFLDFILFIPRLCHKWLRDFTQGD